MSSISSASPLPADAETIQLLLLELGGTRYALPSTSVREILPAAAVTRLPGAPAFVRGLINLRGQLVTLIDLAQRLTGQPASSADRTTVVVQSGERLLGLVVDDVHDVQVLPLAGTDGLPYEQAGHGLIRGLGRSDDEVVIVVDVDELVRQTLV